MLWYWVALHASPTVKNVTIWNNLKDNRFVLPLQTQHFSIETRINTTFFFILGGGHGNDHVETISVFTLTVTLTAETKTKKKSHISFQKQKKSHNEPYNTKHQWQSPFKNEEAGHTNDCPQPRPIVCYALTKRSSFHKRTKRWGIYSHNGRFWILPDALLSCVHNAYGEKKKKKGPRPCDDSGTFCGSLSARGTRLAMWLPLTVTIITVYVIDLELIRQRAGGRKKKTWRTMTASFSSL